MKIISKLIPKAIKKQLINFKILAVDYGQFYTIKNWDSKDKNKKNIPWYTYPAIEYLNNLNFKDKDVFEFGSGNSSKYWAKKSNHVISIEGNSEWYKKNISNMDDNQEIVLAETKDEYVSLLKKLGKIFDVIIIDGEYRDDCAIQAINYISRDGMIILDNSERPLEKEVAKYIKDSLNWIQVDFHGFGPINEYIWTTSIFFSRNFNFKANNENQPISNIGHWGGN